MADFILVSIMVAFIVLCVAYVTWCDRIIGADDPSALSASPAATPPAVAATTAEPVTVTS
jgi:hypothetical protein